MNKLVRTVGLSLVVASSAFFVNAAEAAQKIGYVSTGYIISKFPQREAIVKKLQAELKDDRAELERLQASMTKKSQEIERNGALLGEEGIQKLKIEISQLNAEGQIKQDAYKKKAQSLDVKSRQQMVAVIQKATTKIAEKEGYDMVIDSQILLYSNEESNLTEKVLAELK
ncbi:OmpH family outer membrane protein [Vibrio sp. DW001]|uniref:OmpH family outer membrane protein n=1 Tax=unclassified Vibrio TaxID=2614977 RepID=UPI00189DF69B|nr:MULTISPECIES: OmpH family outer membrane protein [unclassified Vibrio]UGA55501.1 OmpH family outer membrane protein [Vibrio sp. VB16]WED27375.1 OmpH family outer membrane protein [Vibrio sp. DW001]